MSAQKLPQKQPLALPKTIELMIKTSDCSRQKLFMSKMLPSLWWATLAGRNPDDHRICLAMRKIICATISHQEKPLAKEWLRIFWLSHNNFLPLKRLPSCSLPRTLSSQTSFPRSLLGITKTSRICWAPPTKEKGQFKRWLQTRNGGRQACVRLHLWQQSKSAT